MNGSTMDTQSFIKLFEQRSKDMYIQHCQSEINESTRCSRMYKEIKLRFGSEPYMACNITNTLRSSYTKFRLSSHKDTYGRKGSLDETQSGI